MWSGWCLSHLLRVGLLDLAVKVQMCVSVNECVFVCQENAVGQVMRVNIPLSWYRIPSQHASACVPGSGLSKPGARVMERSHYGACRPGFHPCSTAGAPPLEAGGPHNVVQMCVCVCTVGSWEHGSFNLWVRGVVESRLWYYFPFVLDWRSLGFAVFPLQLQHLHQFFKSVMR